MVNVMKNVGYGFLLLLFVLVVMVVNRIIFVQQTVDKSARGVITKTLDSDNVIQNYEWFKQTAQDYDAALANIETTRAQVKDLASVPASKRDWQDKKDLSAARTTLSGQIQYANSLAADYNARSKMMNRSIFKAGDRALPTRLEIVQ